MLLPSIIRRISPLASTNLYTYFGGFWIFSGVFVSYVKHSLNLVALCTDIVEIGRQLWHIAHKFFALALLNILF